MMCDGSSVPKVRLVTGSVRLPTVTVVRQQDGSVRRLEEADLSLCRLGRYTSMRGKGKGPVLDSKGPLLDIALLYDEHMLRSALQSRKWQLIGVS